MAIGRWFILLLMRGIAFFFFLLRRGGNLLVVICGVVVPPDVAASRVRLQILYLGPGADQVEKMRRVAAGVNADECIRGGGKGAS